MEINQTPHSERVYLNIRDLAKYLCISVSSAQKISAARIIPCYKPTGKIILFKKADVDAYIEQFKVPVRQEQEIDLEDLLNGRASLN
jgi:excisionase family DNA binding protein